MRLSAAVVAVVAVVLPAVAAAQSRAKPTIDNGTVDRYVVRGLNQMHDPAVEETAGKVTVTGVDPEGGWAKLGLRKGDVIVAINGKTVDNVATVLSQGLMTEYQDITYIDVLRKGKPVLLRRVVIGAVVPPTLEPDVPADATDPIAALVIPDAPHTWAVDIEAILADPSRFKNPGRAMPATKDGKPIGLRVYAIRPDSILARLGLANGDTITHIDGGVVSSVEKARELAAHVKDTSGALEVRIIRRGKPLVHWYRRIRR
jgi:S1-C subfamily serine protease